jgi:hypothetical protein
MDPLNALRTKRGGAVFKLLVFGILSFGVMSVAWIFFMPMILTSTLSKRTGFEVTVERLVMNPFSWSVDLRGLVVANPPTFPRPDYVQVRSFQARAPLATLLGEQAKFDYVRLDISRMAFVRNTDGTLNATLFYDRLFPTEKSLNEQEERGKTKSKPTKRPDKAGQDAEPSKKMVFFVRRLELKIDEVVVEDHFGRNPISRTFNVGIDQLYLNVSDAKQLFTPAMVRCVGPAATTIGALIPGDLGKILGAAAGPAVARDPLRKPADPMKTIVDTLEESRKP